MEEERERDKGKADSALVPAVDLDVCGVEDVLAGHDGIRAGPAWKVGLAPFFFIS